VEAMKIAGLGSGEGPVDNVLLYTMVVGGSLGYAGKLGHANPDSTKIERICRATEQLFIIPKILCDGNEASGLQRSDSNWARSVASHVL